ncbi:MAG TPA: hypothetical protein VF743_02135 [Acidimicrobiales bacterium]
MCDETGTRQPTAELMIVPRPLHGDTWAVMNRHGDALATGDYGHCLRLLRRLRRLAATAGAKAAAAA